MKLRIIEERWGINRKTGLKSVEKTDEQAVVPTAGMEMFFTIGKRRFVIDYVGDDFIEITIKNKNSNFDKSWKLLVNEIIKYRTRSFDGGYQYKIVFLEEDKDWRN